MSARWVCALLLGAAGWAFGAEDAYYRRFLERFNSIRTLQADFYQRLSGVGGVEEGKGSLQLKRPGRLRWEYAAPDRKLFFLENRRYLCYQPEERQLLVQSLQEEDLEESPLLFLLGGKRDLDRYYAVSPAPAGESGRRYVLTPRRPGGPFKRIILTLNGDPPFIVEISLFEENDNFHYYRFSNVRFDQPVADAAFRFTPPAGTEIIREE